MAVIGRRAMSTVPENTIRLTFVDREVRSRFHSYLSACIHLYKILNILNEN